MEVAVRTGVCRHGETRHLLNWHLALLLLHRVLLFFVALVDASDILVGLINFMAGLLFQWHMRGSILARFSQAHLVFLLPDTREWSVLSVHFLAPPLVAVSRLNNT